MRDSVRVLAMRKFDEVEVIDETVASYRKVGLLVDLTSIGNVIVELPTLRRIELHPHQVDVADPPDFNFMVAIWGMLDWCSE